jgi:hypothetical protein
LRSVFAFDSFATLLPTAPVEEGAGAAAEELLSLPIGAGVVADVLPEGGDWGSFAGAWLVVCCATATPMAPAVAMVATADTRNLVVSILILLEGMWKEETDYRKESDEHTIVPARDNFCTAAHVSLMPDSLFRDAS